MKKTSIILIALLLSGCASVKGVVRDKSTGTPIPSAHVTVKAYSAITNAVGYYNVTGSFLPGDTMMVNAPGYNIYTRTIKSTTEIVDVDLSAK